MTKKSTVYGKSKVLYVRVGPEVYDAITRHAKAARLSKRIVCEILLRKGLGWETWGDLLTKSDITESTAKR